MTLLTDETLDKNKSLKKYIAMHLPFYYIRNDL